MQKGGDGLADDSCCLPRTGIGFSSTIGISFGFCFASIVLVVIMVCNVVDVGTVILVTTSTERIINKNKNNA